MAGRRLGLSRGHFRPGLTDTRHRCVSVADRQRQNPIAGVILAGYGLLFIGIEYLQMGMKGISWNLDAVGASGFGW